MCHAPHANGLATDTVNNLCMQPSTNLDELRRRAAKFMQLEELREFRNQARVEGSGEKGRRRKSAKADHLLVEEIDAKTTGGAGSQGIPP